ncbi:MAG: prepilin-type N-terminal cleavage/methylation domain-containing protein [Patescibacteria group bacterium]
MKYLSHPESKTLRAFTLVEMIVSLGLFSVVMLVATSAYLTLISLDRQAHATNQIVDNLSFAVDTMVRGIRTGTNFQCLNGSPDADGNSTSGACTSFKYTDTNLTTPVTYILKSNGTIGRCEGNGVCIDSTASSLTDPQITIQTLAFYVRGAGTVTAGVRDQQPQVLFVVKGTMPSDSKGGTVPFAIQEGATQRLIDL